MKNAKKLMMMLALSLTVVVMSCDEKLNEDTAPQEQSANNGNSRLRQVGSDTFDTSGMDNWSEVSMTDLPQAAQDYLNENYSGIGIEEGYRTETGEFVLLMDNDWVIIFNADGQVILEFDLEALLDGYDDEHDEDEEDWEEIPLDSLPQSVIDYVAANYPNSTIEEAGKCPDNDHIIVFLDTGEVLEFDGDGNFLEKWDDDWDEDDWEDDFEEVALDSLPQNIKDHLAANYATATPEEAYFDTYEELYYVFLDTDIIVVYDKDGNFVEEVDEDDLYDEEEDFEEIDEADLPQAIKDYLAANYTGRTIEGVYWDKVEELYYVELDNDTYVVFDKDGNFKEEFKDD